jgi:uncharacterized membrane protein YdjX (TVP38/TMEM64 family)
VILVILLAGLLAGSLTLARLPFLSAWIRSLGDWVQNLGIWSPIVYGLVYVAAVLLLLPASAMTVGAGAFFGLAVGIVTASLASITGASLAFLISRYLARDFVARWLAADTRFAAIDRAVASNGWIIVALLRLSPAVPFNLQNYLYGLTGIGFWTCLLTSWVAMLPGTILYVYLGHLGRAGLDAAVGRPDRTRTPVEWAFLMIGLMATLAVTILVTQIARQAMKGRPSEPNDTRDDTTR